MFGSAIFSFSGITILNAGPASLISWFAAAVIMLIYGLITCELVGYFPESGGVYVFPLKAISGKLGKFFGFISCWGFILGNFVGISFSASCVGMYVVSGFDIPEIYSMPISMIAVGVVFLMSIGRLNLSGKINNVLVVALILIMLVFVICSFIFGNFNFDNLSPFFSQGSSGDLGFLAMIPTAIIAYGSIVVLPFMASDVKSPKKTIPIACIVAIVVAAVFYSLIIFACLGHVSSEFLQNNPSKVMNAFFVVASQFSSAPWLSTLVSVAAILSLVTTMYALSILNARTIQVTSADKMLPVFLSNVSKSGQPVVASCVGLVISALILLLPVDFTELVNLGVFFNLITVIIVVCSLIVAKLKFKSNKNGFKLKAGLLFPILFLLIITICDVISIVSSDLIKPLIFTMVFLIIGILIFAIYSKKNH